MLRAYDPISLSLISILSVLMPLAILFGRRSVRKGRQWVLKNLQSLMRMPDQERSLIECVPSFDVAKRKYESAGRAGKEGFGDFLPFLLPAFIFSTLAAIGFHLALNQPAATGFWLERNFFMQGLQVALEGDALTRYQQITGAALSASFIGAYIWSVLYLIRRVTNFDLSPLSFLRAASQLVLTAFTVSIVRHLLPLDTLEAVRALDAGEWAPNLFIGIAFLMGFFPYLGINYLLDRFPRLRLKRPDPATAAVCRSMPLDTIDGIDHFIQSRLEEHEIDDVQNLATSNPILLFIETPYGLYEIIDWVAQAQLITAVGPEKYLRLRNLTIRTVFDLARIGQHGVTREKTIRILLSDDSLTDDEALFKTLYTAIADDLHVRRLAQLWNALSVVLDPTKPENIPDVATLNNLRRAL